MPRPALAITGGTGFVGRHTLDAALAHGAIVRALTRRPQPPREGIEWISGGLDDERALAELVAGADAVIHIAGVTNAPDAAGFIAGNVAGTANIRRAAAGLPFVHVSSLAAREPQLSLYGDSKRRAEDAAAAGSGLWTIVRPPAVYGPGDTELLALFRAVRMGVVPLPAGTRASFIHVADLAAALVALAGDLGTNARTAGKLFEIDDGSGGYGQDHLARAIAGAMQRPVRVLPVPRAMLRVGAAIDTTAARIARRMPKLSFDRARYLAHPDWTADVAPLLSLGLWQPEKTLDAGLADTVEWYRGQGWL
ncbi:MAG: NAD-dependent epimerase/dehydratase family protein [Sphingomonadaceae bacterium]